MGTLNICLYKEVDKKYTGSNLKAMELLDCAVIRLNKVLCGYPLYLEIWIYPRYFNDVIPCLKYLQIRTSPDMSEVSWLNGK